MKSTQNENNQTHINYAGNSCRCIYFLQKEKTETPAPGNTVQSFVFNTNSSAWTLDGKTYKANLTVESINNDILTKGMVNVFLGDGTGYSWTGIPVTVQNMQLKYNAYLHYVTITAEPTIDNTGSSSNPGTQQFKVVVVSGSARMANANVNWNNYNEVKKAFNLKD